MDEVKRSRLPGVLRNGVLALLSLGGGACAPAAPQPMTVPRAADIPLVDAHSQVNESVDLTKVIELMDRAGVQRTILSTNGRMTPRELIAFASKHPGRIIPAVSPVRSKRRGFEDDAPAFLERQVTMGGFGAMAEVLIYHAQKGNRFPLVTADLNAPQVAAALDHARRERWPFILHIEFRGAGPRREELMRKLETLLARHPEQPFVLIHMAQLEPPAVRQLIEMHGNVYFITSHANPIHAARRPAPWTNMFSSLGTGLSADWRELIVSHPDRFILGFDNVFAEDWSEFYLNQIALWRRALSELPPDVAHAIAHDNAERLWRLAPLPARGSVTPLTDPGSGKRYGMEFRDAIEAIQRGEGREALAYYEREARSFPHPFAWAGFGLTGTPW